MLRRAGVFLARFLPPCTFRRVTGFPCPSCGTTRAVLALLGGDLAEAIRFQPLFVLALLFLSGYGVFAGGFYLAERRFPGWLKKLLSSRPALYFLLFAIVLNWLYLILAGI
ncbi:MAG: DUF2752 domain-containing protein [Candidatus Hydrogenedentota bacterium]|nr:MAG: DUF2752 domain-containing protein [Candidatus Hydrogenedentota bacterium]